MAGNRKTLDTDLIYLREVYARTSLNQTIPANQTIVSNGDDSTRWDYIRVSTFNHVVANDDVPLYADDTLSMLKINAAGPPGLLNTYIDRDIPAVMLAISPPAIGISQRPVPSVTSNAALAPPDLVSITNYSSLNFIGVKDVLLSTVTGIDDAQPTVFVSISSFTSAGYSTISGETFAWRPYVYNLISTAQGLPTFTSTIPTTWPTGVLPISTAEAYPNYTTGDAYISSVSINMSNYINYIQPTTTKVVLEVEPTYLLPRFALGKEDHPTLLKSISSYIQYKGVNTFIIPGSENTDMIVSQQSNAFTSNYFNKPMKFPIDSAMIMSNWGVDGINGYYTLYHRIPGGMAKLVPGDACGYYIGDRGGMSNDEPTYMNATSRQNGAFMSIYNRMPTPLTPAELQLLLQTSATPGGLVVDAVAKTLITVKWVGAVTAVSYLFILSGLMLTPGIPVNGIMASVFGKSVTFTGLQAGTNYEIVVVSVTSGGSRIHSPNIYVYTAPTGPTSLVAQNVTQTQFTLAWATVPGATAFTYTLNGLPSIPASQTATSATFTGLTANTSYSIGISASNTGGSTSSSEGKIITTAPTNFIGLTATTITPITITLSWTGALGAIEFEYRNAIGQTFDPVTDSMGPPRTAFYNGLTPGTSYTFVITAVGVDGNTIAAPYTVTTL